MATEQSKTPWHQGPWRLCYDGQIDSANGQHVCSFRWNSFKDFNDSPVDRSTAKLIAESPAMAELLARANTSTGCHTAKWQNEARELLTRIGA